MSKQQAEKLTTSAIPEKPRQHKSFVPAEGELTPAQLETIALRARSIPITGGGINFGN